VDADGARVGDVRRAGVTARRAIAPIARRVDAAAAAEGRRCRRTPRYARVRTACARAHVRGAGARVAARAAVRGARQVDALSAARGKPVRTACIRGHGGGVVPRICGAGFNLIRGVQTPAAVVRTTVVERGEAALLARWASLRVDADRFARRATHPHRGDDGHDGDLEMGKPPAHQSFVARDGPGGSPIEEDACRGGHPATARHPRPTAVAVRSRCDTKGPCDRSSS
jgi:hypothetical protein